MPYVVPTASQPKYVGSTVIEPYWVRWHAAHPRTWGGWAADWVNPKAWGRWFLEALTPSGRIVTDHYSDGSSRVIYEEPGTGSLLNQFFAIEGLRAGVGGIIGKKAAVAPKGLPATTEGSIAEKLERYLLETTHPEGGSKAKWFQEALGFSKENAAELAKQNKFDPAKAVQTATTEFGTKFNQVIEIVGANGKRIELTFAWIRNNDGVVRLVTAIPTPK